MLEARSTYGYYGVAGGVTGESLPADLGCVPVKMSYWEYKHRYPECKTLGDYDKVRKTITVLLPQEVQDRPNFGNRYSMHEFEFETDLDKQGFSSTITLRAKCYKNALRNAQAWARRDNFKILGDRPGREFQRNW